MSNEVEKQVPGVPDGYRLVGIRKALRGELYITNKGGIADEWGYSRQSVVVYPIVELIKPVEPPKSKTEWVPLYKYLVKSVGHWRLMIATPSYMDAYHSEFKLIGPSETIEVEVE